MHASLFTNRAGQKKGVEGTKSGDKKAAEFSGRYGQWRVRFCVSVGTRFRSGPASGAGAEVAVEAAPRGLRAAAAR